MAMRYFGSKASDGVFQRIINQFPPHRWYVEPFAGSAAILRFKRPAERSTILELDAAAIAAIRERVPPGTEVLEANAIAWLEHNAVRFDARTLIYADPPYLHETRSSRKRYRHELSAIDHRRLLRFFLKVQCMVAISGYRSTLYDELLAGWRRVDYTVTLRRGIRRTECLWCNFPVPHRLHDYQWLGDNYRERENIRRQQRTWRRRLAAMGRLRRLALMSVLEETHLAASANSPAGPSEYCTAETCGEVLAGENRGGRGRRSTHGDRRGGRPTAKPARRAACGSLFPMLREGPITKSRRQEIPK